MKTTTILRNLAACLALGGLTLFTTSCGGGGDDHDHGDHDHGDGEHLEGDGHDHSDHDHSDSGEQSTPGPNGGRIITDVEPHLEFLLKDDHSIQIVALTDDFKVAPVGNQIITVTGGDRAAPANLTFTKEGDALVSNGTFPEGKNLPVIVQIQNSDDAEPVFARFSLNLSDCPTCDYKEYNCICAHAD